MKRTFHPCRKAAALALSFVMLFSLATVSAAAGVDYTVVNPYKAVNWAKWGQYKANLHTHSTVSDGGEDFADMVERHYELGYDILGMTDHATVDRSWTNLNTNPAITFVMNIDTFGAKSRPLSEERFAEISNGAGRGGRGMLRVPYGIEHNAAALNNTHVNSFFADCGDGYLGGTSYYDQTLKMVQVAGGLSIINHPGEYTGAKKDSPEDAYNTDNLYYNYIVRKYIGIFKNYPSCLGFEIINKNDSRTVNDRKLWDLVLAGVVPSGRNVFAFGNSDAHSLDAIDTNWNIMCMPSNTVENLRACMESGAFFAASHNIKNTKEISRIETETGLVLGASWDADRNIAPPKVTSVKVDERADTITLTAVNQKTIHWIADGEVVAVGPTIDLDNCSGKIGSYVRAEIWGKGGILYSQPFILEYTGAPADTDTFFFDFGSILNAIERVFYMIVDHSRILSALQDLALGD
ncbi:MAG TPA: hypothetical protein PL044_07570 [Clostridiales bacterium]|nr:MAG: PHP domain protein [Firmicutes bacterium ADurb.Bin262]HOU10424.1 hypothetical protein [Clostridiales bacterium]HQH62705.1 hypothetical protein [Clostridiales bacterium]HQK73618.1 hypothetical protein [Clostridiales bacterium]